MTAPDKPPPIGVSLCCGRTFQLTRTDTGYTGTETHLDHCPERAFLLPETKETT